MVVWQLVAAGLTMGCVYALVALGMGLIFAGTRVVNFAQGEFVMVGALLGITFYVKMQLPYSLAVLLVALGGALLGISVALVVLRLRRLQASLSSLIIVTVAIAFLIHAGAEAVWGRDPFYSPSPLGPGTIKILGASIFPQSLLIWAATAVLLIAVFWLLQRTPSGKQFHAVSADTDSAWLVGINVDRVTIQVFALSASLSAVAGFLFGPITSASAFMGTPLSIKGFAAAMIGGLGSGSGPIVGGLLLGLAEAFAAYFVSSAYGEAVSFVILLVVLFLRPGGIVSPAQGR